MTSFDPEPYPERTYGLGHWRGWLCAGIILSGLAVLAAPGAPEADANSTTQRSKELTELDIEDLMKIKVSIVTKGPETIFESPAAVSVITHEDIRRSGATSIPEALRLVPGLDVARVDAHTWAISSRGFNDSFANKLLVLMDGRSIYTPLFSGVFWDIQNTLLEDVKQIEVIRGPGATLWGANAVNGVINILTKDARETQGLLVQGGGGTEERGFGALRYGGQLATNVFYRVYGQYFNRDDSVQPDSRDAFDSWQLGHGGFRLEWEAAGQNGLTFQGDLYNGWLHQIFTNAILTFPYAESVRDNIHVAGGNLLGRWTHTFSENSDLKLQAYYDRTFRDTAIFKENRNTYDVDLQHHFSLGDRNRITWGTGYRLTEDKVGNSFIVSLDPKKRSTQLFSAFAEDDIAVVPERLRLTLGSKFEHNDYTGFEVQPGVRLAWTPNAKHTVWASVARAVRTPSRAEADLALHQAVVPPGAFGPGFPPTAVPVTILGSSGFGSEDLVAYEIGYRVQPFERLSLDFAAFYNVYHDLRSLENTAVPFQMVIGNGLKGETYGGEVAATWGGTNWWRIKASYTLLQMQLHTKGSSSDTVSEAVEGDSPQNQFSIRSLMDLPGHLELDCGVRYVDSLANQNIPAYIALDVRLGWRPSNNLEFAIVGQSLLDDRHPEFRPTTIRTQATEVEHSVYAKITWRF